MGNDQQSLIEKKKLDSMNPNYVDPEAPLDVPTDILDWQAQKIQVQIARMEKISENNPQQFSASSYLQLIKEFRKMIDEINGKVIDDDEDENGLDAREVAGSSTRQGTEAQAGEAVPDGVGAGISTNDPFSG